MKCLFCDSLRLKDSYLPATYFNGKRFDYKVCLDCDLHFITPIPSSEDLKKMYPPDYQGGIDRGILQDPFEKLPGLRFSYGFQFDLLRKYGFNGQMLDYGCGNAHFLLNAGNAGFDCDGLEYNPKHVQILKNKIPEREFFTVEELNEIGRRYDLIRLSNVFEHFTEPNGALERIREKINPKGYLLVEGPIENNFSLALQYRKLYFRLRKLLNRNYIASHSPTHIIFSNLKNQIDFFENAGFDTEFVKVSEAEWPFPKDFKRAKGLLQKLNVVVARVSIFLAKINPKWGNTFIYLGRLK